MSTSALPLSDLRGWLLAEGLTVRPTADPRRIEVMIPGADGRAIGIASRPEDGLLLFTLDAATRFPQRLWSVLYPALADANAATVFGAWVLHPTDDPAVAVLRFRAALPARGAAYEAEAMRTVLSTVASTVAAFEDRILAAVGDAAATGSHGEGDPEA